MTNIEILPSFAIIDYVWALLKANTDMNEGHYKGRIPIIPSSQQPDFNDVAKPFVVYEWNESPTGDVSPVRTGQMSFAVYGENNRIIIKIANLIVEALNQKDDSAEFINNWSVGTPFQSILFTSLWAAAFDGATPEQQEGGRQSSIVIIRYSCIPHYDMVIPGKPAIF